MQAFTRDAIQSHLRLHGIRARSDAHGAVSQSDPKRAQIADSNVYGSTSSLANARPIRTDPDRIHSPVNGILVT